MATHYDSKGNNKVCIEELVSIFYDEAFLLCDNDTDMAQHIAKDALIDFLINNSDYAVA